MKISNLAQRRRRQSLREKENRRRRLRVECLEDRRVLAGAFTEFGSTLSVNLDQVGQQLTSVSKGDHYEFTLATGTWSGMDSARVNGNGTNVLTVTNLGLASFSKVEVIDSAPEVSFIFDDSGLNTYADSFDVNLDEVGAGTISFTGSTNFIETAGLTAKTTGQITLLGESTVLTSVHGDINLSANEQTVPSEFSGKGVEIISAKVAASGVGAIRIFGRGGGSQSNLGGDNYGIAIKQGGIIQGGSGEPVELIGYGGLGDGKFNYGILVIGENTNRQSTISTIGATIDMFGAGGGNEASSHNHGIVIQRGGRIHTDGFSNVRLEGRGGIGTSKNHGVVLLQSSATGVATSIQSEGSVEVFGIGGGNLVSSHSNYGVAVFAGAKITTLGNGSISVTGHGGKVSGTNNLGVLVSGIDNTGIIQSETGSIVLNGYGGGTATPESSRGHGVEIYRGGAVLSSTGEISVNGTGGVGTGGDNQGVVVSGISLTAQRSKISSQAGSIHVSGVGGGQANSTSSANNGVLVIAGGRIEGKKLSNVVVEGKGGKTQGNGNHGILVNSLDAFSSISVEHGSLVVNGFGGGEADAMSSYNRGVAVFQGGRIEALGSGDITIEGTGGLGGGNFHDGVFAAGKSNDGVGAMIAATSGNLSIIGLGGGSGSSNLNSGVNVENGGLIQSGQEGDLAIRGTGGRTEGEYNIGVRVNGSNSEAAITSLGGHAQIDGIGGGSASSVDSLGNYGVNAQAGGVISVLGTGSLAINGTGGVGAGNANKGIQVAGLSLSSIRSAITAMSGTMSLVGTGGGSVGASFNHGVEASNGGMIQSADGSISISATGGGTAGSGTNHGITVLSGGIIRSTFGGSIDLIGKGGQGLNHNYGVNFHGKDSGGSNSVVETAGSLTISGTGGGQADSSFDWGVTVSPGGLISGVGSGTVHVEGTGGSGEGLNYGVLVMGTSDEARITTENGDLSISGNGGGSATRSGPGNRGVWLLNGGVVEAGGAGNLTVTGIGGPSTGNDNYGVEVSGTSDQGQRSTLTTQGGAATVTGQGGGTGVSANNRGVTLENGGLIETFSTGFVTIRGEGGQGFGEGNRGILVDGSVAESSIQTESGNVVAVGLGGGTVDAISFQKGVVLYAGGVMKSSSGGNIAITGQGGTGKNKNYGVELTSFSPDRRPAMVSSSGDISISGTGGGQADSSFDWGVTVSPGGLISGVGSGTVHVEGTGGSGEGLNYGVLVMGTSDEARITTENGDLSISGNGGGSATRSGPGNRGVWLLNGGVVEAGGAGNLTVTGIGGPSTGNDNYGVEVSGTSDQGQRSTLTTQGGAATVTGQGGGTGVSANNRGVTLENGGLIQSADSLEITATGSSDSYGILASGDQAQLIAANTLVLQGSARFSGLTSDLTGAPTDLTGVTLVTAINGSSPDTEYEQLDIDGAINVAGMNLSLHGEYVFTSDTEIVLINNDGTDSLLGLVELEGNDAPLLENDLVHFNGVNLKLSYLGGDGNDLALTPVNLPPTIDTLSSFTITEEASEQTINLSGITAGSDENQPLRVSAISSNPTLIADPTVHYPSAVARGTIRFSPEADRSGVSTITVTVEDGGLDRNLDTLDDNASFSRTFDVTIHPSPSTANDDQYDFPTGDSGVLKLTKAGLLSNDSFGSGESVESISLSVPPVSASGGMISFDGEVLSYTRPTQWFVGLDKFAYTINDGSSTSTAIVTIKNGFEGDTLTVQLAPGTDHQVVMRYDVSQQLLLVDEVSAANLATITKDLIPSEIVVLGAPSNHNQVTFNQLANDQSTPQSRLWKYIGGSESDNVRIVGDTQQWAWLASGVDDGKSVDFRLRSGLRLDGTYRVIESEHVTIEQVDRIDFLDAFFQTRNSSLALHSEKPVNLPTDTTLDQQVLNSNSPVGLHTAESLVGSGRLDAVFSGGVGSLIRLTGDLAIGDAGSPAGFRSDGFLEVGENTVTLLDSNQASLGELTTLGNNASPGTLISDHGLAVNFTGNIEGYGTLQSDANGTIINNGSIVGTSAEQPITINSRVKGVGTFDNVVMNGEFTPGFSPALWKSGTVAYTDLNRFVIELGGRIAGSEFDRVEHYLAKLGGTLDVQLIDGFKPALGDVLEVITSKQPFEGNFKEILLPLQENGVRIREILDQHGISLETVYDVAETLEVLKSQVADYEIAGHDGSGLRIQGDRFRAFVTSLHQFVAEHPWHTEELELQAGKLVQIATDGINRLIIEGSNWKNFVKPSDVNNDQNVSALDALTVINELGRRSHSDDLTFELDDAAILVTGEGHFYDQNGDGKCTALDALRVINELARISNGGSGEGESVTADYLIGNATDAWTQGLWSQGTETAQDDSAEEDEFEESHLLYSDAEVDSYEATERPEDLVYTTAGKESTEAVDSLLSELEDWLR